MQGTDWPEGLYVTLAIPICSHSFVVHKPSCLTSCRQTAENGGIDIALESDRIRTVLTTVLTVFLWCAWMLIGATDAPTINRLRLFVYLTR
jgi:hypothetical protein